MPNNNRNNENINPNKLFPVKIPSDDELFYERDFFAYGILKEGELAHSRIDDLVDTVESDDVPRKMFIKDGSPLIVNVHSKNHRTVGDKIHFLDGCEEDAYERISNIMPGNIYRWDIIKIGKDEEEFNILVGKNYGGLFLHVDEYRNYMDTFDGSKDLFFTKVTKFIRNELEELNESDECYIFKIPMYYMLLWSAIDRYCALKYDVSNSQRDYLEALSNDEIFLEAMDNVNPKTLPNVHSARNGRRYYYNTEIPLFIINHYYTTRSNVVHRGKEEENNFKMLIDSLNDLMDIFDYIIKKTFKRDEES